MQNNKVVLVLVPLIFFMRIEVDNMDGRLENQKKGEAKIKNMMKGQPEVIHEFYVYLNDKTYKTKIMYINRAIAFVEYLNQNAFDVTEMETFTEVKPSNVNDYMEKIRYKEDGTEYSESYRALQLNVIKSFFQFLEDDGYVIKNPARKLKAPRVGNQTNITYLTKDEIKQIKRNMKQGVGNARERTIQKKWYERDYAIFALALCTGLRIAALLEINISDIDFDNKMIRVTEKENITKDVYLSEEIIGVLQKWIDKRNTMLEEKGCEEDALFISFRMKRMDASSVNEMIKKYTYNIDKKITAHKLRSTFATNIYEATGDIYVTSHLLGHSNIETTKRYAALDQEKERRAMDKISKKLF